MPVELNFTQSITGVGTEDQAALLEMLADKYAFLSKGAVTRYAISNLFGLKNDRLPKGETLEDAIARVEAKHKGLFE